MKLSVAMCTFNGEKYIKYQIDSILNQTLGIDQIIICDDGSADETINILEKYKLDNPDIITLIKNPITLGSNKNFEQAISLCDGDYIFLSDQDDIWKKNKSEQIIKHFSNNESTEAVFSNAELIDDINENFTKHSLWDSINFIEDKLSKPVDLFRLLKFKSNMVTGATLCFKKEVKSLILTIPDKKEVYHDEWIAIMIASRNKLTYLTDKLISYRIHSGQQLGIDGANKKVKTKKYIVVTNHILGNSAPLSYTDNKRLGNIYFGNYLKFKMFSSQLNYECPLDFSKLSDENLELFKKAELNMKKINPIMYYFRKKTDKLKGQRQII